MSRSNSLNRTMACVVLVALAIGGSALSQSGQISRVTTPGVAKRMATMNAANTAMKTLTDMMGGRVFFDRKHAQQARRDLMKATGDIPGAFRKPHVDPLSNARSTIWQNWRDFRNRAKIAQRASRSLDTDSLSDLRKSLPKLLRACLNCHGIYREPMN